MKELSKNYQPQESEDEIYKRWEESGYFNPDNLDGEPFSIMMPPPNVTGVLHLGHAMENTIMDIMVRYQRMNGKKALLLPGTDHAAVATQAKVEKLLIEKGVEHPREELGREKLLHEIRKYAEESKATIISQIRKMGTSCDWSRLAYTFDDKRSLAVNTVFEKMYKDGLIYQGHRVVNWSVKGQSTCSDDELEHKERPAKLYTFKYSKDFPITIATTRPETKLGDSAVAVNPKDERYKKYIGKTFTVDIDSQKPLEIKIIADDEVAKDFGTGALGVTPAHSPIDFAMYEKQKAAGNPINLIQVIDKNGKMTATAGDKYAGLSVEDAREKFVEYLKENNLLEKEEDIVQSVGTSDRFGDVVEALPMTQWFIDVNKKIPGKNKSLKELMKDAVTTGLNNDKDKKINIVPERFESVYFSWIDNLRDWCISRQVWWGHQIPVWYKNTEIYVGIEPPKDKENWTQDPDTLDTWFSSGLWTFSTLGWPEKTADFKTFHPTSWMQMGRDILFFWMARMILMTTYTLDNIPFENVYMHGMLRDKSGNKFSKSSGNNIDPLDIIEKYGADALRLSCVTGITPGNDLKIYDEKIESSRNFTTKLWNIGRYITSSTKENHSNIDETALSIADNWILTELEKLIVDVTNSIDKYNFSRASELLRSFTWDNFADWYVEIHKVEKNDAVLIHVYKTILKLWHPFMPFVTETIWQEMFNEKKLLMITKWPTMQSDNSKQATSTSFDSIKDLVTNLRNIRAIYKIPTNTKIDITLITAELKKYEQQKKLIQTLAKVDTMTLQNEDSAQDQSASSISGDYKLYVHLAGVIDIEKEKERLEKEISQITSFINTINKKLNNKNFVANAPKEIIEKENAKLSTQELRLTSLKKHLENIN
jgi:valyl-tRNA synthetase